MDKALVLACLGAACLVAGGARAETSDESAIRELRRQYNQAIQSRDPDAFARFLRPTFTEMVSTGEVTRGAKAVADSYAAGEFNDPKFIAYDRQPDTIVVAQNGRLAVERGHWRALFRDTSGAEVGGAGSYQAGWVRSDVGWRIQTEAYVQLTCKRGDSC